MTIIATILGGAAGFALGGPIGALIGAVAGHALDRYRDAADETGEPEDATRKIGFTIGVIALGAKMAKADGVVTKDEIAAFKSVFRTPPEEEKNVARIFNQARQDAAGFEPYAHQLAGMLKGRPRVLEELLDCLFEIAKADGKIHPDEMSFLEHVGRIFGFEGSEFTRIRETHLGPDESDPYNVLGVSREASDDEIRSAYLRLIRDNHPDKLIAEGMPEEFVQVANAKMAAINGAYAEVRKERGFN